MMALGLMPFIYVLGSKVNFISMLTGVSHERLQVYHQCTARFMLFLATVHTIPFIRQPLTEGGIAALREWYFSDHLNTTGTVAYACLFVLVFGSFAGLRGRCYELFVVVHTPVAVTFLVFMFVHTVQLLTSWRYLWATAALYMFSVFLWIARQISNHNIFCLRRCRVQALDGNLTRLTIRTPLTWRPGQHVFVHFPKLAPWAAHPFTIISMPRLEDGRQMDSTIVLMAKARGGLTKKLYALALAGQGGKVARPGTDHESDGDDGYGAGSVDEQLLDTLPATAFSAIIDGPYGQDAGVADFHGALFVAGGSGITLVMASLLDLAWQWRQGTAMTKRARQVWSVRREEAVGWMHKHIKMVELLELLAPKGAISIAIHISAPEEVQGQRTSYNGGEDSSISLPSSWEVTRGCRPDIAHEIEAFLSASTAVETASTDGAAAAVDMEKGDSIKDSSPSETGCGWPWRSSEKSSAAVVVCGPDAMSSDAANHIAQAQLHLARGRLPHLQEVSLVNERFGW